MPLVWIVDGLFQSCVSTSFLAPLVVPVAHSTIALPLTFSSSPSSRSSSASNSTKVVFIPTSTIRTLGSTSSLSLIPLPPPSLPLHNPTLLPPFNTGNRPCGAIVRTLLFLFFPILFKHFYLLHLNFFGRCLCCFSLCRCTHCSGTCFSHKYIHHGMPTPSRSLLCKTTFRASPTSRGRSHTRFSISNPP